MARSKAALDPVQAARKAAQTREAKRNKQRKNEAQEARTLRQDTSSLERQIHRLETRSQQLTEDEQQQLTELKEQLHNVQRVKRDYVAKHPDQRDFVRGFETKVVAKPLAEAVASGSKSHHIQDRDPRWSIYYDATFNPYGAPPPGMVYLEKSYEQLLAEGLVSANKPPQQPPLPEESEEEHELKDGLNGITMPDGTGLADLSAQTDSDSDSSIDEELKDIIMPPGPPPIPRPSHSPTRSQLSASARGQQHGRRGVHRAHSSARHQNNDRARSDLPSATLPAKPSSVLPQAANTSHTDTPSLAPASTGSAVITAAPQLRNLQQEATVFTPASIRKKQSEQKSRIKSSTSD